MTQVDIAALQADVAALKAALTSGTTLASFEGGNFGYQMVDSVYPARCRFLIPTRTMRVNKALLHFSLQPFRAAIPTAALGGGGAHNHKVMHYIADGFLGGVGGVGSELHVQMRDTGGAAYDMYFDHQTGWGLSSDLYTYDTATTHTHVIPAPAALTETGMAQGSHVYIDGVDVTSSLGGPWGTGTALDIHDLDVSQWLSAKGWHEVQISSTSLGGIFPSLAIFAVVGV